MRFIRDRNDAHFNYTLTVHFMKHSYTYNSTIYMISQSGGSSTMHKKALVVLWYVVNKRGQKKMAKLVSRYSKLKCVYFTHTKIKYILAPDNMKT